MQRFIDRIKLDREMTDFLLDKLMQTIPKKFHHSFRQSFRMPPRNMGSVQFQQYVTKTIAKDPHLSILENNLLHPVEIEGFLYRLLPIFPGKKLEDRVKEVLRSMPGMTDEFFQMLMENFSHLKEILRIPSIMSVQGLRNVCKAVICLTLETTTSSVDYNTLVNHTVQEVGYGMPRPILFADTNWATDMFGFAVSPGTGDFELWRMDDTGTLGHPMRIWKHWLDGSRKEPAWDVYPKIYQYLF
jgi:hypothetical protein